MIQNPKLSKSLPAGKAMMSEISGKEESSLDNRSEVSVSLELESLLELELSMVSIQMITEF